jgi:hypothetical protein
MSGINAGSNESTSKEIKSTQTNFIKIYNDKRWVVRAEIFNMLTNELCAFFTENITSILIRNSIKNFAPSLEFTYKDSQYQLSEYLQNFACLISFLIEAPDIETSFSLSNTRINNSYYLINTTVIDKGRDYISYRFTCIPYQSLLLHNTLNYSNNKTIGKKSPYKIIQEVLNNVGYKFESDFKDTDARIDLISSRTSTVLDIIDYCLHKGISKKCPPTYFFTDIINDKR